MLKNIEKGIRMNIKWILLITAFALTFAGVCGSSQANDIDAFVIAGLWMMVKGGKLVFQAYGTKEWEHVTGKFVESTIEKSTDSDGNTVYRAEVFYTYSFQDKSYNGNRIHYGYSATNDREDSEALIARYSPGEPAPVYINPKRPVESVLVRGIQKYALLEVWGGFGVGFFGYEPDNEKLENEAIVEYFPVVKKVAVYINQAQPEESLLFPGIQRITLSRIWGGIGLAFMGFWFFGMWYLFGMPMFYKSIILR